MANKIIISRAFAKELSEHSRPVQKAVNEVYGKLMRDEGVNGLNLETIKGAASSAIKSVRVNNNYRVVLHQDKKGNFTFLYVGTHEKAYDWAARNRFEVNAFTGELQLYVVDIPVVSVPSEERKATDISSVAGPFAKNPSDDVLMRLGIPSEQLALVRSLAGEDDILLHEADFPKGAFEAIMMLYDGKTPEEVMAEMELPKSAKGSTDDVITAVQASELSQAEFAFASNDRPPTIINHPNLNIRNPNRQNTITETIYNLLLYPIDFLFFLYFFFLYAIFLSPIIIFNLNIFLKVKL